jgi:hypothetical protein
VLELRLLLVNALDRQTLLAAVGRMVYRLEDVQRVVSAFRVIILPVSRFLGGWFLGCRSLGRFLSGRFRFLE